jgi:micrococcal nuclease
VLCGLVVACSTTEPTTVPVTAPEGSETTPAPAAPGSTAGTRVVDVVDGDTLDVQLPDGAVERVRIVGINAPEQDECHAREAAATLDELVAGKDVRLVADHTERDRYGRLLRYVEVDGDDVGVRLVRDGAAVVRVSQPDDAREAALRAAEAEARAAARGLWDPAACGAPPLDAAALEIVALRLDADGDDVENLNDEWVDVRNTGDAPVDLTGWRLRDESASHRFEFPAGFVLGPGAQVRVHSGCGSDEATALHWCATGSAIWNNDGDTAFLLDPSGNIVASRTA